MQLLRVHFTVALFILKLKKLLSQITIRSIYAHSIAI